MVRLWKNMQCHQHLTTMLVKIYFVVFSWVGVPALSAACEANVMAGCETPPSYDVATSSVPDSSSNSNNLPNMTNADLLCRIDAGVQIYFITPEGYVSAPSYPNCLSIYLLTDGHDQAASATNCESLPAFLQVGNWVYPLLPGQSPVLQSNWDSYIFPDVSSSVPGTHAWFTLYFSSQQQIQPWSPILILYRRVLLKLIHLLVLLLDMPVQMTNTHVKYGWDLNKYRWNYESKP